LESGSPAARPAALGITLPAVAVPLAAYVPAERTGAHVHTSGQLPFVDGTLLATGKAGAAVAVAEARACVLNALAAALADTPCQAVVADLRERPLGIMPVILVPCAAQTLERWTFLVVVRGRMSAPSLSMTSRKRSSSAITVAVLGRGRRRSGSSG
jgi:hypothetical protein